MKSFEQFFLTSSASADHGSMLDTPLNFWAIECSNPLSAEHDSQEYVPTRISLNHSRAAFVQRGQKSSFGILDLNIEFHDEGYFSLWKFSRRIYFLCNDREVAQLKHFFFLIAPPSLQQCFYGERLPLKSLFFHSLKNPFYYDKHPSSLQAESIKAHPVSYIGWEIKTKHSFKSHNCVQAEVKTPNGVVFLRSRVKHQQLPSSDEFISFIPYPILLFRHNRRTHFRLALNETTLSVSVLTPQNLQSTAVDLCNKGLCLKLESAGGSLLDLELEESIEFECFEQRWSGVLKWTRSESQKYNPTLFWGVELRFAEKSSKLIWIKHVHRLSIK